ncbi:LysR family transcriptional regulator [Kitasatospora camelliae]|uniref:LysR family transcriptional regulator n=1 Tax=Kitasatospora camelliae TaxID=3156397 RepID=A0AAU8JY84_9ACTN
MLDPVRLLLLRELADRGTMTAVAAACGYTSSAVSQQLATLERESGTRLFERAGRRVRLTAEGRRLAGHARTVLAALQAAEDGLRAADTPRGPLAVGCFATMAAARLIPALAVARVRHPQLRLTVHEWEPPEAVAALREGRCEVAVRYAYDLDPEPEPVDLDVHPLAVEPLLLAVPEGHPVAAAAAAAAVDLRELAGAEWIAGSRADSDRTLVERACAIAGYRPRITHTADDYHLVLRMVAHGLGVALVPRMAVRAYGGGAGAGTAFPGVALREVSTVPLTRRITALTRPASAGDPAVRALLDLLRSAEDPSA